MGCMHTSIDVTMFCSLGRQENFATSISDIRKIYSKSFWIGRNSNMKITSFFITDSCSYFKHISKGYRSTTCRGWWHDKISLPSWARSSLQPCISICIEWDICKKPNYLYSYKMHGAYKMDPDVELILNWADLHGKHPNCRESFPKTTASVWY